MASDDMKKMLLLIESCSCESNKEELDEVGFMPPGTAKDYTAAKTAEELAHVSDEALDNAYHYGRSNPGNSFGWQANVKSAEFAKKAIEAGETDIEKISDAIHKGWNVTAKAFVSNPDQFSDTEKLRAAGKLEAKLAQREKLMNIEYAQLPEDEKEKDRVVARALFKAIKGKELGQEASSPEGVEEDFEFDAFMESIREMVGGRLDELDQATLTNYMKRFSTTDINNAPFNRKMGASRASQRIDARRLGQNPNAKQAFDLETGINDPSTTFGSYDHPSELTGNKSLNKYYAQGAARNVQGSQGTSVQGAGRNLVLPPKKPREETPPPKGLVLPPKRTNTTEEVEQTQEDAEFQSFMETLNYVMRKK